MSVVTVREARKEDSVDLFQMMRELAAYQKVDHEIKIDHTILQRDGFESALPAFRCFVAEQTDTITQKSQLIGYTLFYNSYSCRVGKSIFAEDLFVKPEFRNTGAGKKLFLAIAKVAQGLSGHLFCAVLAWNKSSIEFYKRMGVVCITEIEDWHLYRFSGEALNKAVERNEK